MATSIHFETTTTAQRPDLRRYALLAACAGLPLGAFGLVNLGAESLGFLPLYFAPFGLPGWTGAAAHLIQLGFLGLALAMLVASHADRRPLAWLAAFIAGYILLPFITPPLDSLQLTLGCSALFLLGLASLRRVGAASPAAAWLMSPVLAVIGFSATMGLVLTAAYTPPFALTQGSQTPAA